LGFAPLRRGSHAVNRLISVSENRLKTLTEQGFPWPTLPIQGEWRE